MRRTWLSFVTVPAAGSSTVRQETQAPPAPRFASVTSPAPRTVSGRFSARGFAAPDASVSTTSGRPSATGWWL